MPKTLAPPDGIVKQEVAEDGVARQYSPPSSISISHKNQNVNKKDTADRINGLERPKPNEGYALTNGILINLVVLKRSQPLNSEEIRDKVTQ